jgi:hypothetical protein
MTQEASAIHNVTKWGEPGIYFCDLDQILDMVKSEISGL